jgi:hypothetical protein
MGEEEHKLEFVLLQLVRFSLTKLVPVENMLSEKEMVKMR